MVEASAHKAPTSARAQAQYTTNSYRQADPTDEDVFQTMVLNKKHLPPIRFDCGTEDQLIQHNRLLSRRLIESGIPHVYEEFEGAHEWSYWQKHLVDTLKFFDQQL